MNNLIKITDESMKNSFNKEKYQPREAVPESQRNDILKISFQSKES